MAIDTSLAALMVATAIIDLTYATTSLSNSTIQSLTNFLDFSIGTIPNLFAAIDQIVTDLDFDPSLSIFFCSLIICGSFGILIGGIKYGTRNTCNLIIKIPYCLTCALPRWIVFSLAVGMELFVMLFINLTLITPLACLQWLRDQQAGILWRVRTMGFQTLAPTSGWLKNIFGGDIGDALTSVLVGIWDVLFHWKRQGYRGLFRRMVLVPGLILPMFVNMAMYFLVFLPVAGLGRIWDFFTVEIEGTDDDFSKGSNATTRTENGSHSSSMCMSDNISELDLNDDGDESETCLPTCTYLGDREKTAFSLHFHDNV